MLGRAYLSAVIDAPVEDAWAVVGDFHGVAAWITRLRTCTARGPAGNTVGAVREFTVQTGETHAEELVAHSDDERAYSYRFVTRIPFPVDSYVATARMHAVTLDGTTFLEWSGEFEAAAERIDAVRAALEALYAEFVRDLRRHLASHP